MINCPNCGNELKDTAKFCGKCGTKIEQAPPQTTTDNQCVECGAPLKPGAKFCPKCGAAQTPPNNSQPAETPGKGYIRWEMEPGQLAARLTEDLFAQYSKAKGVVIPEGYLAMVMVGGKMQSMLQAGIYSFTKKAQPSQGVGAQIVDFFTSLFSGRDKENSQNQKDIETVTAALQRRLPVEIVICRSGNFSLPFTFSNIATSSIKVDVGLLLSMQVLNLVALYKNHLLDKTVLPIELFAKELMPYMDSIVKNTVKDFAPEDIAQSPEVKQALDNQLKPLFAERFAFLEYMGAVKIETAREELERLERLSEEMYLSERELEQLSRRNEFMNRLTQEQNNAELQNAQNAADFNNRLAQINKDNLLTEEELANVQREIQQRAETNAIEHAAAMEMMVLQHQNKIQEERVKMEEQLGTRLFNLQMERQKQTDEYQDERRRKEMAMDREEQLGQLDLLRQAQALRQEREEAELARKLKEKEQEQTHEKERLQIFAGMSAEQIMVANPAISAEAAKAMAEKFKAEAAQAANDSRAADAQEQTRMMKEFMEQQMQTVRDMSVANAQAMGGMMTAKEREIERTQQIVDKNEDRYAGVVQEKIKQGKTAKVKVCTQCGYEVGDEPFCPECGTRQ